MTASYALLLDGTTAPGVFSWRGSRDRDLAAEAEAAGWRTLRLDTTRITSAAGFYDEVTAAWDLPPWFGRNLDALFDVLGDLTQVPTVLVWDGLNHLADVDPVHASAVVDVFRDGVGQAETFAVIVRDDLGVSGFDALS